LSLTARRQLVDPAHPNLSIEKQCELLDLSRSTYYYASCREESFHLSVMKEMDVLYTQHPYYGKRRMSVELKKLGYDVGVDLARTLMRRMGLEALYPKPNLSQPYPGHRVYPYLLRGIEIERVNQAWSTDITYLRMRNGFLYLTAVIDWYSRYVLAWRLSNSLDGLFCREVVAEALRWGCPEVFNTDQGSQYTCLEFIRPLEAAGIQISMDGRGRALDNVWIERLWRTVKQEEVYIRDYGNGREAAESLERYFKYYNEQRPHSSLGYLPPQAVYRRESLAIAQQG